MDRIRGLRLAITVCAAALLAAACAPPGVAPQVRPETTTDSQTVPLARLTLLYVSDWASNDVAVYNYETRSIVRHLSGFKRPSGICVDRRHNVWIADFKARQIVEYAHGGKQPLKTLQTDGYPIGCAVNINSGSLAVANFYTDGGPGDVQIWKNGSGTPTTYQPAKFFYLWPPAYDDNGNLYVEGGVKNGTSYGIEALLHGGNGLRVLSLKGGVIHYAGAALWDGKHLGITDQSSAGEDRTVIYRATVSGSVAKIIGRTHLADTCGSQKTDVVQPFIVRSGGSAQTVVGGNLWCANRVDFWKYPNGGVPQHWLRNAPAEPFGAAVTPPLRL